MVLFSFTPSYNDGVIHHLITDISEDDFNVAVGGQVEIIGWLYQYYNTEPHDQVVNITGGPVKKQDIPAATQLFTTDWVVKYMVDNSLGKYWLERHPDSSIKEKLKFLLPSELSVVTDEEKPEEIRVIDNAMGSGHILVYAFDVLMAIYREQGYSSRESAKLILQNNLYGLEIDRRAYQLAYFALMMKARQYNRHALENATIKPHVFVFEDTDDISPELLTLVPDDTLPAIEDLISRFNNARELGSIIDFEGHTYDWQGIETAIENIKIDSLDVFDIQSSKDKLRRILEIAHVMTDSYDVVVTNPPYMNKMDVTLKKYVKKHYTNYASDLFSIFIYRNSQMTKTGGYAAFMTPFVWMFIKTYEKLRKYLIDTKQIDSLIQMEYSAFEEATVPINTFVLKNTKNEQSGTYLRLSDFKGGMNVQRDKVLAAIQNPTIDYLYRTNQANFNKIPGMPIAYWASKNLFNDFVIGKSMGSIVQPRVGLQTGSNTNFIRFWYEVVHSKVKFNATSILDAKQSNKKWFPYNKGGSYRKWYGNYDYVVNWENDGQEIRNFTDNKGKVRSRPQNTDYYFHEAITWSDVNSGKFSLRYRNPGSIHDVKGMSAFTDKKRTLLNLLALMNTKVGNYIFNMINPTISLQIGNFQSFPVIESKINEDYANISKDSIRITKLDWDFTELSWEFKHHPFLLPIADEKLARCRSPIGLISCNVTKLCQLIVKWRENNG